MAFEIFKRTGIGENLSDSVNRNLDDLERLLRPVLNVAILQGNLIELAYLSTTVAHISHKLDRAYKGWFVVDQTTTETVYRDDTSEEDTSLFLSLKATGTCTVKLWVF